MFLSYWKNLLETQKKWFKSSAVNKPLVFHCMFIFVFVENEIIIVCLSMIVSMLQTDISGNCDTEYTTGEGNWYHKTIKKSKNLLSCTERNGYNTAIQGIPYSADSVSHSYILALTLTTLRANSADRKCVIFFLFFPENFGDNLHEMSNPIFWAGQIRKIFQYVFC